MYTNAMQVKANRAKYWNVGEADACLMRVQVVNNLNWICSVQKEGNKDMYSERTWLNVLTGLFFFRS